MFNTQSHHRLPSITQTYHDTVAVYIQHFWKLVGIGLIPNVLTYILIGLLFVSFLFSARSVNDIVELLFQPTPLALFMWGGIVLTAIVQAIWWIALVYLCVHYTQATIYSAFEQSIRFFWRFLLLAIAVLAASIVGVVVGYLVVLIIGAILGSFSMNVLASGYQWIAWIPAVPAALVTICFVFAGFSIMYRNSTAWQGLRESYRLVRAHFWPVALRVLLLYAVLTVLAYALQFVPTIGGFVYIIFLTPFSILYLSLLYQHLIHIDT